MATPKSRREFLIGTGATLAVPRNAVAMLIDADAALLAGLTAGNRRLVLSVLEDYPALPIAKAIHMLNEAGM